MIELTEASQDFVFTGVSEEQCTEELMRLVGELLGRPGSISLSVVLAVFNGVVLLVAASVDAISRRRAAATGR